MGDLENAVKELEEITTPQEETQKSEPTIGERLVKSIENLTGFLKKAKPEGEESGKKLAGEEFQKSFAEGEQGELIDGEVVLAAFRDGLTKSLVQVEENVSGRIGQVEEAVKSIGEAVLVICKSQAALHKMLESTPKSTPMPGLVTNGKGREEEQPIQKSGGFDQAIAGIEQAVHAGKLEATFLGRFSSRPEQTLGTIPEDVAKSFNIPRTLKRAA